MQGQGSTSARVIGGSYRIGQVITAGRMLTIYTGYNRNTNDIVGLFVVDIPPTFRQEIVEQFLHTLSARRQLQSPHLIKIYDWGIDGSRAYIATDPPRGVTLRYVLDNENIDIPRALDMVKQLLTGLKALHEQGIADLDLRPQLITVDSVGIIDRVQIDDIGLRTLLHTLGYMENQRSDEIGYLDPHYSSPEVINHTATGVRSDIYQIGLLTFEVVTGRPPFRGRNPAETGVMQASNPVPRMKPFKHDVPDELQDFVNHALAKDPAQRFASAAAMLTALESIRYSPTSTTGHYPPVMVPVNKQANLTAEISLQDIALLETQIEGRELPPRRATQMLEGIPTPEGIYAYLRFEQEGDIQRIPIKGRNVVIGRLDPKRGLSPDVDLSPIDQKMSISRQHARIRFEETFFYIEDLKSRNKTRLGELPLIPLKAELLQHGDVIYFGSVRVRFEVPGMGKLPPIKEPK